MTTKGPRWSFSVGHTFREPRVSAVLDTWPTTTWKLSSFYPAFSKCSHQSAARSTCSARPVAGRWTVSKVNFAGFFFHNTQGPVLWHSMFMYNDQPWLSCWRLMLPSSGLQQHQSFCICWSVVFSWHQILSISPNSMFSLIFLSVSQAYQPALWTWSSTAWTLTRTHCWGSTPGTSQPPTGPTTTVPPCWPLTQTWESRLWRQSGLFPWAFHCHSQTGRAGPTSAT